MKLSSAVLTFALGGMMSMLAEADNQAPQSTQGNLVELSIKLNDDSIGLSCLPKTEAAGVSADWVVECNRLAYAYLSAKSAEGVMFLRQINTKPFGMAADFIATNLMQNPAGFKAVNISQDFEFTTKKT
ncbi:hypothetical protein [Shewanella ulleungensis]|jgi:hypothetical protein|uniref:Uncharacterized protein n=1 Tax=Shewanella ulleungensis TaxID=2282699 RepID=A0ABQ2QTL9_9GAMM|nr:hypothetical protein [Shewanella ulleungensis]MCL1151296.1 hypothetical protein [Shewanella ulleungensis]GGP97073.1 hypothetical protein GCM10009410_33730 [Shewanella ulleungensis]